MTKIRFYSFIRIPMPGLFPCLCGAVSELFAVTKCPPPEPNPVGSTFNIQNPIPHKSQKTKAVSEMNRAKEFQRGTAGVPESAKECARPLAESSDIGLGPGDRAFESHYSDESPSEIIDFRGIFLILFLHWGGNWAARDAIDVAPNSSVHSLTSLFSPHSHQYGVSSRR